MNVDFQYESIAQLIKDIEVQLKTEVLLTHEAEKMVEAREFVARINDDMKLQIGEWRFTTPELHPDFRQNDSVLAVHHDEGVPLSRIKDPEVLKQIEPLIAEAKLRMLFKYGYFDADRHRGNWLIKLKPPEIAMIDLGQSEHFSITRDPLKPDEIYTLSQFLFSAMSGNEEAVLLHGMRMTEGGRKNTKQIETLRTLIHNHLSSTQGKPVHERLMGLVNSFSQAKIPLKTKFSFGALKGLVVLSQEGYLPQAQFQARMGHYISQTVTAKIPQAQLDFQTSQKLNGCNLKNVLPLINQH